MDYLLTPLLNIYMFIKIMVYSPKKRNCKRSYSGPDGCDIIDNDCYIQENSPIKATQLGLKIESLVISLMLTTCCNAKMIAAKRNQKIFDCTCFQCGKKIQIKTTSLNYRDCARVTTASIQGTCNSPVSIYKFQIKNNKITKKSVVYTPNKSINGQHYILTKQDTWGGIVRPCKTTSIKRPDFITIKKINRQLKF